MFLPTPVSFTGCTQTDPLATVVCHWATQWWKLHAVMFICSKMNHRCYTFNGFSRGDPCTVCTSLESTDPGLSFCHRQYPSVFIYFHTASYRKSCIEWGGALWLIKFIKIGANLKPICDFLLVFLCKYMPVWYHFWDITIYPWKIGIFCLFYPP